MRQGEPAFGHHLDEITKAELVAQIPAHTEHDDLLIKVAAFEKSVHFRVRSSALSFDRFANDYAVSKQFAPEPWRSGSGLHSVVRARASKMGATTAHLIGKAFGRNWPDCRVLLATFWWSSIYEPGAQPARGRMIALFGHTSND